MTGLVENGVRAQTSVKENDDPEAFPFQTKQTRLNRRVNTQGSAYSVSRGCSLYAPPNRNSGSAMKSATRVGNTEEARVFRENFYGGKNRFFVVVQVFQCLNKKDNKKFKKSHVPGRIFQKKRRA